MPSFFWGCVRYQANERYQHDHAISFRYATVDGVLSKAQYLNKISDTDLRVFEQLLVDQVKYYKEGEPITEDMLSRITKIYGGTPNTQSSEGVAEYINTFVLQVATELKRRQLKTAILPDVEEDSEQEQD
jgi:radical SAM superfamily enzyme with C-terminal helix-hairpin-helix motif